MLMLKKQLPVVLPLSFVNQNELQVKLTLLAKTEHSRNLNLEQQKISATK